MKFIDFLIFKENNSNQIIVSGPGIDLLKSTLIRMIGLGAPVEKNDIGFNGTHYPTAIRISHSNEFHQEGLPINMVSALLAMFNVYKKTQITNYEEIRKLVNIDVKKVLPDSDSDSGEMDDNSPTIIINYEITNYNKYQIKSNTFLNNHQKGKINVVVGEYLDSKGIRKEYDSYHNLTHPWLEKIKVFSIDKNDKTIAWVHPEISDKLIDLYKSFGYKVIEKGNKSNLKPTTPNSEPKITEKAKIKILGIKQTPWGKKLGITHNLEMNKWFKLKEKFEKQGLWRKSIGYTKEGDVSVYLLSLETNEINSVIRILSEEFDTQEILNYLKDHLTQITQEAQNEMDFSDVLSFVNIKGTNKIEIRIKRKLSGDAFNYIREIIVYTFPENSDYIRGGGWSISGSYNKYVLLGRLLKEHGIPVDEYRNILKEKLANKDLKKESIDGDIPSESWDIIRIADETVVSSHSSENEANQELNKLANKNQYKIEHSPGFQSIINQLLPNKATEIELYDAQKEGIEYLFHRNQAILGDETGLGKTIQLISAAEIKMQELDSPTLILAINDVTAKQWAEEILRIIGQENKNLISLDCHNPKKWTVLTYNLFSHKKKDMEKQLKIVNAQTGKPFKAFKTEEELETFWNKIVDKSQYKKIQTEDGCIEKLIQTKFGIIIFDELHKIKSDKTKRWERLTKVIDSIPVRWGATATISANNPLDVKNQLDILGHSLGRLPAGRFKKDFAGMELKDTPVGPRYVEGSLENRLRSAERLNKWLHLTGVYIRRKKSDIKEMPNLTVGSESGSINVTDYRRKVTERINQYDARAKELKKDPNSAAALKELIANRTELATAKVPLTIEAVKKLLLKGKRVVVFTAFKESAELLKVQLEKIIKEINPNHHLLTYISSTSKAEKAIVKNKFNKDQSCRVLLMSLKMGSTGIDFPNAASEMVINDYEWSPESAEQSEGRIYRINTTQDVNINYIIANGTFDEKLFEIVQNKRIIAQKIQAARETFRKEKDLKKSQAALDKLVELQKELIKADDEIKEIEKKEVLHTVKTESFKHFLSLNI